MVTLAYLRSLPDPRTGSEFDRDVLLQAMIQAVEATSPGWSFEDRGRLARALQPIVESIWMQGELSAMQATRYLLSRAIGDDLVQRGADAGLRPNVGESSDEFRERIARAPVRDAPLTDSIEDKVREAGVGALDVTSRVRPNNRFQIDIWALKAENQQLTVDERRTVETYLEGPGRLVAGTEVFVNAVTLTQWSPVVKARYDRHEISGPLLTERIEAAIKEYAAGIRLGQGAFVGRVYQAENVPGTQRTEVTTPALDAHPPDKSVKYVLDPAWPGANSITVEAYPD